MQEPCGEVVQASLCTEFLACESEPVAGIVSPGGREQVAERIILVGLLHCTHLRHHRPDTSQMVTKEEHIDRSISNHIDISSVEKDLLQGAVLVDELSDVVSAGQQEPSLFHLLLKFPAVGIVSIYTTITLS